MEAIAAVYSDWGIGDGTTQPVTLKADRQHFREITRDAAVIVGRKTLEDFPGGRPLKGRMNIVVTRQPITIPDALVAGSPEEALQLAAQYPRCLVIGGASIYEQFFSYINKIYITKIGCCPNSVRFFPDLDREGRKAGDAQRKALFWRKRASRIVSVFTKEGVHHAERQ